MALVSVLNTQITDYPQDYIDALNVIKEVLDSDLRHLYKEEQLLKMSYTDPLTQIYNRRILVKPNRTPYFVIFRS
ncbi:hypothetical protein HWQ47_17480 [Shewanella sp. MTB7]|nr:hypothetical protein [Shewanella sp. MTB7]WBJ93708.1 hypothetical protein HWQ47_17480 [Shewanella sp. MTB7]